MSKGNDSARLPRALRKHLRRQKAILRATLPPEEARRAVEQLVRRVRRGSGSETREPSAADRS